MIYIAILDSFSALRVIGLALAGRDVYLLDNVSELPGARQVLARLARLLITTGRVRPVEALGPDAATGQIRRGIMRADDWYRPAEPAMLSALRVRAGGAEDPEYGYAAEKQATKHGFFYLGIVSCLETLLANDRTQAVTVIGGDKILEQIYRTVAPVPPGLKFRPSRPWSRPVNLLLSLVCAGSAMAKVLSMFRLRAPVRKPVFMAIDVIDNPARLLLPVENTLDDPATQALFVFRSRAAWKRFGPTLQHYPCCPYGDGAFSGIGALCALGRCLSDALCLFVRYGRANPGLFLKVAKLNPARVGFQGLFNRYDAKFFCGRDEYNAEHILRSQEFRKRGGTSFGLVNGVNIFGWDVAYRYIDYDITYVYAPGPFLKYNRENWRKPDGVRQIGAVNLSRSDIREMVREGKSANIVCFAKNYCDGPEFFEELFKVGRALPERTIFVSLKRSAIRLGGYDDFLEIMKHAPENVVLSDADSFDLIRSCRYVLSGESSIIAEAINLGSITYFLDTYPEEEIFIYREYPGLAYRNGDEIAHRIHRIEAGTESYPIKSFADLADISGWLAFDVIRRDLGLTPEDPPILSALWEATCSPETRETTAREKLIG